MTLGSETTLEEVRNWLAERVNEGALCPCCGQNVKVYRRKLNSGMVRSLIEMYRVGGTSFIHIPSKISARSREEGKLAYWGLAEEDRITRSDGGRAGYWRVTEKGELFLAEATTVPKYAIVFNGECLALDGEEIFVRDALDKFDLAELMGLF